MLIIKKPLKSYQQKKSFKITSISFSVLQVAIVEMATVHFNFTRQFAL